MNKICLKQGSLEKGWVDRGGYWARTGQWPLEAEVILSQLQ